jgi:hypothetical protein
VVEFVSCGGEKLLGWLEWWLKVEVVVCYGGQRWKKELVMMVVFLSREREEKRERGKNYFVIFLEFVKK